MNPGEKLAIENTPLENQPKSDEASLGPGDEVPPIREDSLHSVEEFSTTSESSFTSDRVKDSVENGEEAEALKTAGNEAFKAAEYHRAIEHYSKGILKCPSDRFQELESVLLCNRAACRIAIQQFNDAVADASEAITLNPKYSKAYLRRCRANSALEKWHDALSDINRALELDPNLEPEYGHMQKRIQAESATQFEREKEEMMDKLKSFGNWALGKVGLSLDNFQVQKNEESGAYNISFQQNQASK